MIAGGEGDFRLRKDRQIRFVLEKGRLFRGQKIILRALPSDKINPPIEKSGSFLAVVISSKREKRAVRRNRMKRQLREIFRTKQSEIPQQKAYVVVVRQVDKQTTYQELEKDFLNLIQKSKEEK